ncbi:MAG TPA: right-handed parallel beta-helix repeat-containing protein [Thermoanaerobaculia bacterium]|nr:right-handed parallel beta-helix repeat-containing protein [Thermoanaerobaculia bacterium]
MRAASLATLVSLLLSTAAFADLAITFARDANDPFHYRGTVTNTGTAVIDAPRIRFDVIPALRISATMPSAWSCTPPSTEGVVICGGNTLQPGETLPFQLFVPVGGINAVPGHYRVIAQAETGNRIELPLTIPYGFAIQTAADLRNAIEASNANCQADIPCGLIVDINAEAGPQTFSISQPLVVTACQFSLFSPRRPPDLSDLKHTISGAGFVFEPSCDDARININGLNLSTPGDAIVIRGGARATYGITRMSISTPGARGIYIEAPNADVAIRDGFIASGRSGVTAWAARSTTIETTEIGPTRASGVFVGPNGGSLTVRNSVIHDNPHFGIALAPGNAAIALENAQIRDNTSMDIDWGLDGPSATANVPPTPRVTSVTYDAARNVTRIVIDPQGAGSGTIEAWASDGVTTFGTAHLVTFAGRAAIDGEASVAIEYAGTLGSSFVSAIRVEGGRISEPSVGVR